MKKSSEPVQLPPRGFARRAKEILQVLQKTLLPEHATEIVAINVETGEYVLGRTVSEALTAFRTRWPNQLAYFIRAEGGPAAKFHGM